MSYQDLAYQYAQQAGISRPDIFVGLINEESGFDPNAISSNGAIGLGQVLPSTAASPGYGVASFDPYDTDSNLQGSANYFGALLSHFGGNYEQAASAYNLGVGAVENGATGNNYSAGFNAALQDADGNTMEPASFLGDAAGAVAGSGFSIGNWLSGGLLGALTGGNSQSFGNAITGATKSFAGQSGVLSALESLGLRVSVVLIGIFLLCIGIYAFLSNTETGKTVIKAGSKAAMEAAIA